jgi:hypothetical protein
MQWVAISQMLSMVYQAAVHCALHIVMARSRHDHSSMIYHQFRGLQYCRTTVHFPVMYLGFLVTCRDDFFGQEIYQDPALWTKYMTEKQQLLLSCHLYSCS